MANEKQLTEPEIGVDRILGPRVFRPLLEANGKTRKPLSFQTPTVHLSQSQTFTFSRGDKIPNLQRDDSLVRGKGSR